MVRKQTSTHGVTAWTILNNREFARGLDEVRRGEPFDPNNDSWDYERGRCFGFIAPLDMPLRIDGKINPRALRLAELAFGRKLLL